MRYSLLTLCVAALIALPAAGHDEGQAIKLFDGETTYGWMPVGDAQWTVEGGALKAVDGTGGMLATTSRFADFSLTAKIRVKPGTSSGIVVRSPLSGHPSENGSAVVYISEPKGAESPWREVKITADGDALSATLDGKAVENFSAANEWGHIGILYHHNGESTVEVSEMTLRPLALHTIFNGQNLEGWNIIPERKSVFSVIDGALNIKDGNGQIETAEVYKNFVLQLDIFSNGEHLNSGVFFRGPVGEFWRGYESQVRNQWVGDDRTKPVDFGTGGNYGNQPARKVVPSDKEWFSKTVVVDGNHAAVWINGYQVSDFFDNRPIHPAANGKEGYVPGPGTIHLQGHDPTTDLSFKNIMLGEYPED